MIRPERLTSRYQQDGRCAIDQDVRAHGHLDPAGLSERSPRKRLGQIRQGQPGRRAIRAQRRRMCCLQQSDVRPRQPGVRAQVVHDCSAFGRGCEHLIEHDDPRLVAANDIDGMLDVFVSERQQVGRCFGTLAPFRQQVFGCNEDRGRTVSPACGLDHVMCRHSYSSPDASIASKGNASCESAGGIS